jgi:hypothetical protein
MQNLCDVVVGTYVAESLWSVATGSCLTNGLSETGNCQIPMTGLFRFHKLISIATQLLALP